MDSDHFLVDIGGHLTSPLRYDFKQHPNYVDKILDIHAHYKTTSAHQKNESFSALITILTELPHVEMIEGARKKDKVLSFRDIKEIINEKYPQKLNNDIDDDNKGDDDDYEAIESSNNFADPKDHFFDNDNQTDDFNSYAHGLIKPKDLINNGIPTHNYDDIFSLAYSNNHQYFIGFPFKKDLQDNSLLIKDQNSDNYLPAIDDTHNEDPKLRYLIRPAFIDFLLNQKDWYDFADGEFAAAVDKLLQAA